MTKPTEYKQGQIWRWTRHSDVFLVISLSEDLHYVYLADEYQRGKCFTGLPAIDSCEYLGTIDHYGDLLYNIPSV